MEISLFVLSILTFFMGYAVLDSAQSAIHEIEAFVLFIVSAVFFSGAGIVTAVNRINETIKKSLPFTPQEGKVFEENKVEIKDTNTIADEQVKLGGANKNSNRTTDFIGWECNKCGENIENQFSECWQCGTSKT